MKRRALLVTLLAAGCGSRASAPPPATPNAATPEVAADGPTRCDEYDEVVAAYVRCDKLPQPLREQAQQDHDEAFASRTDISCMLATTPLRQLYNDNGCYTLQPLEAPAPSNGSGPELDARLPSCAEAIGIYEAMAACEAVPQESRDELLYAIEEMRAMWQASPDLEDEAAVQLNDECAASLEPLREQLAMTGCTE